MFLISCAVAFFFRDPPRFVPEIDNAVVSAADGVVLDVSMVDLPKELNRDEKRCRVSVFLGLHNVHVNRCPFKGVVKNIQHVSGEFSFAGATSAEENERCVISIENEAGEDCTVVQIAGFLARRIVCTINSSQGVEAGERLGVIKFGSRVDVYCPEGWNANVTKGQKVVAGETIICTSDTDSDLKFKKI